MVFLVVLNLMGCTGNDNNKNSEYSESKSPLDYTIERSVFEKVTIPDKAYDIIDTVLKQHMNVKEYHVFQNMKCEMSVGSASTSLFRKSENTIFTDPIRCEILSSSNLSDYGKDNRFYVYKKDGKYNEHINIDGDCNDKPLTETAAKDVINDTLAAISPDIFLDAKDTFSVDGKSELEDGTSVTILKGQLSKEAISKVLSSSSISTVIDSNLMAADVVSDAGVTIYIDNSNSTVKKIETDLTEYMSKLFEGSTDNKIESFAYTIDYESLQNVKDFTNP